MKDHPKLSKPFLDGYTERVQQCHLEYGYPSSNKRLLLIYWDVPRYWTKEYLRDRLTKVIFCYKDKSRMGTSKINSYVIQERIIDDNRYFFCLLEFKGRISSMAITTLDVDGYSGDYRIVRELYPVISQLTKGQWIEEGFNIKKDEYGDDVKTMFRSINDALASIKRDLCAQHTNSSSISETIKKIKGIQEEMKVRV